MNDETQAAAIPGGRLARKHFGYLMASVPDCKQRQLLRADAQYAVQMGESSIDNERRNMRRVRAGTLLNP